MEVSQLTCHLNRDGERDKKTQVTEAKEMIRKQKTNRKLISTSDYDKVQPNFTKPAFPLFGFRHIIYLRNYIVPQT